MGRTVSVLCLFGVLFFGQGALRLPAAEAESLSFQIVVHPDNPVTRLDRVFVRDAFLKRIARWPNGEAIMPADLSPRSHVRTQFAQAVLGRPLTAVRMYWQQVVFSGRGVPPPEFDSDEAALRYVRSHRGAISYLSVTTSPGDARVVQLQ